MEIVERDCTDPKLITLISGLKAVYMDEFGVLHQHLEVGTPEGSILSPLLYNIFLHELDLYMETLKTEVNKGTKRKNSLEYIKLSNKVKYMRKKGTRQNQPNSLQTTVKRNDHYSIPKTRRLYHRSIG